MDESSRSVAPPSEISRSFLRIHSAATGLLLLTWIVVNPHDWYVRPLEALQDTWVPYKPISGMLVCVSIAIALLALIAPLRISYRFKGLSGLHKLYVVVSSLCIGGGILFMLVVLIFQLGFIKI